MGTSSCACVCNCGPVPVCQMGSAVGRFALGMTVGLVSGEVNEGGPTSFGTSLAAKLSRCPLRTRTPLLSKLVSKSRKWSWTLGTGSFPRYSITRSSTSRSCSLVPRWVVATVDDTFTVVLVGADVGVGVVVVVVVVVLLVRGVCCWLE